MLPVEIKLQWKNEVMEHIKGQNEIKTGKAYLQRRFLLKNLVRITASTSKYSLSVFIETHMNIHDTVDKSLLHW